MKFVSTFYPHHPLFSGGVDSDDNLNIVAEPGQDLSSFPPPAATGGAPNPPAAAAEAFGAAPPPPALPYILPSKETLHK